VGPNPLYCPIISSAKNTGNPIKIAASKYGIKKAPPPFLQKYPIHSIINLIRTSVPILIPIS